jgi:hypothetical protein
VVRVIEYIAGKSLGNYIADIDQDHERYFHETLGGILENYLDCLEAIRFLHAHGEKHGDVRRDHILIETRTGRYRWIDFDYNYRHWENIYGYDLFGLGNILIYIVGRGDVLLGDLKASEPEVFSRLTEEDLNIIFNNRLANLKKVYPYIPDKLNRVLLHFSNGTNWFYENTAQLIDDLQEALGDVGRPAAEASAPVA